MTEQTPPPAVRIAAAQQALKGGYLKNDLAVRSKICAFFEKERGVGLDPETEISLTTGSQTGLDSAFKLLIEEGDEMLMVEPEYATYEPMIHFYGGIAKTVPLLFDGSRWSFDREAFARAFTDRTKMVLLSNPNNPVGYVYGEEELAEIARLVKSHGCWLLSDEIWSTLILNENGVFRSMGAWDEIRDRLLVLFSASKTFGMSGYRTGAILGPPEFISAVNHVLRFVIQAAPTIGQVAFARALDTDETGPWVRQRIETVRKRADWAMEKMSAAGRITCSVPDSGVFLFPWIKDCGLSSLDFASRLIEEKGVFLLPGYFYGKQSDGFVRISMSVPEEDYRTGMERIFEFVESLDSSSK